MDQQKLNELRRKAEFLDRHEQTILEVKDLLIELARDVLDLSALLKTVYQLKLIGQKIAVLEASLMQYRYIYAHICLTNDICDITCHDVIILEQRIHANKRL
jgi:hypothetical protein